MRKLNNITFTNARGVLDEYSPKPALNFIPDWYKKTESYIGGEKKPNGNAGTVATIKRCIPVFDALTAGYIITLPADVYVSQKQDDNGNQFPWYEWSNHGLVTFHPVEQAPFHPAKNGFSYPKWNNPWGIKTPNGYSTLFVQPFHRESVFTILPGIVDTDTYTAPINFPFVLNNPKFEGLIPVGTPIAQVIPIKRNSWQAKLGTAEDLENQNKVSIKLHTKFFDMYKNLFWNKKEYK